MKKLLSIVALVGLTALAVRAAQLNPTVLINGPIYTSYNQIVGVDGTNSSGVFTNNVQQGVVLALSTNFYNLSWTPNSQVNSNQWPAAVFSPQGSYPNTLAGPSRLEDIITQGAFTATNAVGAQTIFIKYAKTADGTVFITNALTLAFTASANSLAIAPTDTNYDSLASGYFVLQEIDNTNAVAVTNLFNEVSDKPGF